MPAAEIIPNPDPSLVTNTAIDRAVTNAKAVINARIDGMEKAVEVFQADLTRVPTTVDRQILALRELLETRFDGMDNDIKIVHKDLAKREHDITSEITHLHDLVVSKIEELAAVTTERFLGVAAQFSERDTRTDQRAGDTKLAVDAAFAAAKEATAKIEAGFTKQIDAMISIIDTKTANLGSGLSDLKDRLTTIESRTQGITSANSDMRSSSSDNRNATVGIIGSIVGVVGLLIAAGTLIAFVIAHGGH